MDGDALAMWKSSASPSLRAARTSTMSEREAAAPGAVGHAVGRRRRRRAVPGRRGSSGTATATCTATATRAPAWSARPISSTATTATRCRAAARRRSRATGATPTACAGGALPVLRPRVQPGHRHRLRRPQAARRRLDGVPPRGLLHGSLAGAARSGRRSATTPPYWLAKLLAVLEGVQEGAVLAGRVEIDEMMYPLPLADQPRMPDGSKVPGGFSGKHCIGIGCDGSGASVFADEGLGKTSGARTLAAFGGHVRAPARRWSRHGERHTTAWSASWACAASGATQAHQAPARPGEPARRGQPALLSAAPVPRLPHEGFDRTRLGGYLDLFWVMMNPPRDKMEKGGVRVGSGNAQPENAARYRDFGAKSPSSDDEESSSQPTICKGGLFRELLRSCTTSSIRSPHDVHWRKPG
ncbi:MAG: hypothetical protein ACLTDR_15505 [Adlercreutzia equolifaciens]